MDDPLMQAPPARSEGPIQNYAPGEGFGSSDMWSRIQDALKRGLINSNQFQQMAQRMGYTPQNVGQTPTSFQTGVKAPDIAGNGNVASNFGSTVGGLVGQAGRSIYDKINAPAPAEANSLGGAAAINPPSPAWNQ